VLIWPYPDSFLQLKRTLIILIYYLIRMVHQLTPQCTSVEESKRSQSQTQSRQDYERSRLQYEEAVRNNDYQLAQLGISLSAIEDKLADIPIVRSPRNGYIKKIKPWVGKDGKYTTSITIVSNISPTKN